jgi:hypothetical protein
MTFEDKRLAAIALLASRGVKRPAYAPTIVTWLWRAGLEVPPPHFAPFLGVFAFAALVVGITWGALMWIAVWSRHGVSPVNAAEMAAVVGAIVGLVVAGYYWWSAKKLGLGSWSEMGPADRDV